MNSDPHTDCACRRSRKTAGSALGLDELMIINPSESAAAGVFLDDDGTLYQVQGIGNASHLNESEPLFLGDDGSLYRAEQPRPTSPRTTAKKVVRAAVEDPTRELGGYLLAADGTLYEVTK